MSDLPEMGPSNLEPKSILETEAILDTVGTLIVVFNRQGEIQRFNRTCETMTGYTESEVRGHRAWDFLLAPEERLAMQGIFDRLIGGQINTYSRTTWLGKGGEKLVIAWSNTVLANAQGNVEFVISSGIDVTEQHKSQRQLEGQYRQSHLLAEITREIAQASEIEEILQTTVNEVQALLGCDRILILQALPPDSPLEFISNVPVDAIQRSAKAAAEAVIDPAYRLFPDAQPLQILTHHPLLSATYIDHYRQQSVSVIDTMLGLGISPAIVDILNDLAVKSELVVPILTQAAVIDSARHNRQKILANRHADSFWGLLIAHQCDQSRRWSPLEIDLMQQLASQISVAINHAELLAHLEELVEARTAELTTINQQLRQEMRERQKSELAMRRSEKQLRLITNALPALVSYIDTYHRYRFNNYAYETWYDIPYQQIKGKQVTDIVSPQVYQQMLPYLEQALAGEKVTYEAQMILSSGQRLWASISYIPDVQENRVQGLFSLISDISDRKAAEQLKDEFVSVVSHELRTPLTSIHGSLKLLSTGKLGQLGMQGQNLINIALNNTERLTRLVNDVLDLEKMSAGRVNLVPMCCSAVALIKNATQAMQSMASDYGITLITGVTLPEDRPESRLESRPEDWLENADIDPSIFQNLDVWADPDQIMQALTNLLSNAIKFSPQGATVLIKARATEAPSNKVEFLVKDYGRGIPSDKLETIFERFQQVDTSDARERGGTGLGLAICRSIVQQHEGRIWVKSVHGKGSSFYFTLPKPGNSQAT